MNSFADGKPEKKNTAETEKNTLISLPEMEWGNPADINSVTVEELKAASFLKAPEMIWGSPEELDLESIESLKDAPMVPAPAMIWGDANDFFSFNPAK
jgi:hypothetical protein